MSDLDPKIKRRLERERNARKQAESLLEEKSLELYQANQKLQAAHDDLEERVRQRTAELQELNDTLEGEVLERKKAQFEASKARDQAVLASKLKSEFLANMSHEIRTPMNAIIGLTNLLLETELSFEQHDFLSTINASSEALLTIINDILDFSRIEANKLELDYHPFSLRECIEEGIDLLAHKAFDKGLELAYIMEPPIPEEYTGDMSRIRQIIVNLLNNAIKFTETGEVIVTAKATKLEDYLHEIHIVVRDTGIGIPEDRMHRLFSSFSQVDASTTRKYGGTGLGLAICKRLSEMMDGRIWVESEVGVGSAFQFTIQLQAVKNETGGELQGIQDQLRSKKLLIIDDNPTNCLILTRQTEAWGMVPTIVHSGEETLTLLEDSSDFEVALVDMQMPNINGVELAQRIKKERPQATFPMIMLSSIGAKPAEVNDDLFAAYATKPIKPSTLRRALVQTLNGNKITGKTKKQELESARLAEEYPMSILLAEDNPVNQKVAQNMFKRIGYTVDISANGLEALSALRFKNYDVVFMDVQMPEMDGIEATNYIHQEWGRSRPFIIAMTANAMMGDRERFLAAGMDSYISKPVRLNDLKKLIESIYPELQEERSVFQNSLYGSDLR